MPGGTGADSGPRRSGGPDAGAGHPSREGAPRAALVYDGLWYSPLRSALQAFISESQRHVTGEVRLRFAAPGTCAVVGRRSPVALYDHDLATYDASDSFRHADAEGFVRLWGLGVATWSARQGPGAQTGVEVPPPAEAGEVRGEH